MEGNALITVGLPLSLFIIMVGMGLSLTVADFRRVGQQPSAVALGSLLQLLVIPLMGFAIGGAAGGGILAVGLVLLAALPGGTTSNVLCYLARANLALSITLTVIASLAVIFTLPLYVNWALEYFVGESADLNLPVGKTLITMFVIVVIPVGIGMVIRAKAEGFAAKVEPMISKFALVVLIVIVVGILIAEWANLPVWLAAAWLPVLALNIGALAVGVVAGKLVGLTMQDALTVAIELGIKNTTLGLTIALSLLQSTELALPAAVYGLFMYASVAGLAVWGRRIDAQNQAAIT